MRSVTRRENRTDPSACPGRARGYGGTGARGEATFAVRTAAVVGDRAVWFAGYVSRNVRGPVLTYSQRLALVREAQRRGIGRFEANLIIAAVLHRAGMGQELEELEPASGRRWGLALVTFAVVQGLIVAGAWWVVG